MARPGNRARCRVVGSDRQSAGADCRLCRRLFVIDPDDSAGMATATGNADAAESDQRGGRMIVNSPWLRIRNAMHGRIHAMEFSQSAQHSVQETGGTGAIDQSVIEGKRKRKALSIFRRGPDA